MERLFSVVLNTSGVCSGFACARPGSGASGRLAIPRDFDYAGLDCLSAEEVEKLTAAQPATIQDASAISGVPGEGGARWCFKCVFGSACAVYVSFRRRF